jgi:hypothetical protein
VARQLAQEYRKSEFADVNRVLQRGIYEALKKLGADSATGIQGLPLTFKDEPSGKERNKELNERSSSFSGKIIERTVSSFYITIHLRFQSVFLNPAPQRVAGDAQVAVRSCCR